MVVGEAALANDPTIKHFDDVAIFSDTDIKDRKFYNRVRMQMQNVLHWTEGLYVDCDCDIHEDLSHIEKLQPEAKVLYVKSPVMGAKWPECCLAVTGKMPEFMGNNGMLYIRQDMSKEYEECEKLAHAAGAPDRMLGTYTFNLMILKYPELIKDIPYENSVIWWDYRNLLTAKTIQYCNDEGQQKRVSLEAVYRNSL